MATRAAASVSLRRIGAALVVADPVAGVSVSVPVASIQAITVVAGAQLDVLGFHPTVLDSVVLSDALAFAVSKQWNDSVALADAMAIDASKALADAVALTDAASFAVSKALADSVSLGDSGLILMQNYTGPDYFAEDYVGESRAF